MNTATTDNNKPGKNFAAQNRATDFSNEEDSNTQRQSNSGAKSKPSERSSEGATVTSMKDSSASSQRTTKSEDRQSQGETSSRQADTSNRQSSQQQDGENAKGERSAQQGEGKEVAKSTKSPGFVEQLDLALVDAAINIGDVVKKIEALSPKEGGIARAAQYTASKLEGVQNYLGDNGSKEILGSAWSFVRRSPWPVGLAMLGAGIGFYIQMTGVKSEPVTAQE